MINKQKYHRLMNEYQETGNVSVSAMRADVSRPTARKYVKGRKTPGELQVKHTWRTRRDPLESVWVEATGLAVNNPRRAPEQFTISIIEERLVRLPIHRHN